MDIMNLGIREYIVIIVALYYLIIGSIEDIKTREIMDYSNFSLVALGFILNLMFSIIYNNWMIMFQSILGFIAFFIVAYIMFYAGQWGGGDSKMIMGLGALFGLDFNTLPFLLVFFISSLFLGSIYGLTWTFILSLKYWKRFFKEFKSKLNFYSKIRNTILFISIAIVIFSLLVNIQYFIFGITFSLIILLGFYLWIYVKAIESGVMYKKLSSNELTEGDWIVDDIYFNKKKFLSKGLLEEKDIHKIYYHIDKNNYMNKYFKIKIKKKGNVKLIDLKLNDILDEDISTSDFKFKKGHKISKKDLDLFNFLRKVKIKRKFIFWNLIKNVNVKNIKYNDILLNEIKIKNKVFSKNHKINQDDMNFISETLNKNKLLNVKLSSDNEISAEKLKIGMKIIDDIYSVDYLCGSKDLGISREQIALLKQYEDKKLINKITVKEGVPFVPSFLMAFIFSLIFYNNILLFF